MTVRIALSSWDEMLIFSLENVMKYSSLLGSWHFGVAKQVSAPPIHRWGGSTTNPPSLSPLRPGPQQSPHSPPITLHKTRLSEWGHPPLIVIMAGGSIVLKKIEGGVCRGPPYPNVSNPPISARVHAAFRVKLLTWT